MEVGVTKGELQPQKKSYGRRQRQRRQERGTEGRAMRTRMIPFRSSTLVCSISGGQNENARLGGLGMGVAQLSSYDVC